MGSKLSAGSIRIFLFADVLADLLQMEPEKVLGQRKSQLPEIL